MNLGNHHKGTSALLYYTDSPVQRSRIVCWMSVSDFPSLRIRKLLLCTWYLFKPRIRIYKISPRLRMHCRLVKDGQRIDDHASKYRASTNDHCRGSGPGKMFCGVAMDRCHEGHNAPTTLYYPGTGKASTLLRVGTTAFINPVFASNVTSSIVTSLCVPLPPGMAKR